jgi:hypothetical protein
MVDQIQHLRMAVAAIGPLAAEIEDVTACAVEHAKVGVKIMEM